MAPADIEPEVVPGFEVRTPLLEAIPDGVETSLLRRAGFVKWADLFPSRQLATLLTAADAIDDLEVTDSVRARLRLAVCGAGEMAGFLSRWDRYYPKAFEAMANHRFPALGFACETNLLAKRGRGTLRRRLSQSVLAALWSQEFMENSGPVRLLSANDRRRTVNSRSMLTVGSSERQLPSTGSIDLILTDPPYFDDVQYAELASLFLVWSRALELVPETVTVDLASEAVVNSGRGAGVDEYGSLLTRIFREANRTLNPKGRLVLTFHNTDIRAWWVLSRALHKAGFGVHAIAVAEAENGLDHSKRGKVAFTRDLVIECRPGMTPSAVQILPHGDDDAETRELLDVGQIVAIGGELSLEEFIHRFREQRGVVHDIRANLVRS